VAEVLRCYSTNPHPIAGNGMGSLAMRGTGTGIDISNATAAGLAAIRSVGLETSTTNETKESLFPNWQMNNDP